MNLVLAFLVVFVVPIGLYFFWRQDGFKRVLRSMDLVPGEKKTREVQEAQQRAEAAREEEHQGLPNFGIDEFDRLVTAYHWEETEKRKYEEELPEGPRPRVAPTSPEPDTK
eukprot:TRINITY_DN1751_c0_g1_i2.p1 TRINITY_DN1751_c0_g1~~TRINITY_DN1751_c0_g1_i2.p1  ORF type:complete len:111 (+),score=5.95 TRINITY_DN1751_c0_g1_i2:134-466(+)